jgi:hypothetical protein
VLEFIIRFHEEAASESTPPVFPQMWVNPSNDNADLCSRLLSAVNTLGPMLHGRRLSIRILLGIAQLMAVLPIRESRKNSVRSAAAFSLYGSIVYG